MTLDLAKLYPFLDDDFFEGILTMDGYDDAFVGYACQADGEPIAVYDRDKCLLGLVSQGMSEEAALEYFEFNTLSAYVGERTPMLIYQPEKLCLDAPAKSKKPKKSKARPSNKSRSRTPSANS